MVHNAEDRSESARQSSRSLVEILALHGCAFVEAVYRRLLLREPDESGLLRYLGLLRDGWPKILILDAIARSPEGRKVAVKLPGLARLALLQRMAAVPVLGALLREVSGVESMAPADRRLRCLEELLYDGSSLHPGASPAYRIARRERRTALLEGAEDRWPESVTDCEILWLQEPQIAGEMAIVVADLLDDGLPSDTSIFLETFAREGIGVILVIATDMPANFNPDTVPGPLRGCFIRRSRGHEFAAWAHILRLHPLLFTVPRLYLVSDLLLRHSDPTALPEMLAACRSSDADLVGVTARPQHDLDFARHILSLQPGALGYMPVHEFVNRIRCLRTREQERSAYGLTLAAYLRSQGLRIAVRYSSGLSACPVEYPAAVSSAAPRADDMYAWRQGSGPRRAGGSPLRVAFIGPWPEDDCAGLVSRGFIAALWHTDMEVNLVPLTLPRRSWAPVAPSMPSRSFSGDADLVIVNVAPSVWSSALDDGHRRLMSRAGRVVGAWSGDPCEFPADPGPVFDAVSAIWTASTFGADELRLQSGLPVDVVPWVVPVAAEDTGAARVAELRSRFGIVGDGRLLLYCVDPAWYPDDRSALDLVAAFDAAGLARSGWVLVLQVEPGCLTERMERALASDCDRVEGVRLVQCVRRRNFMSALLAATDLYASPHAGTAFGLSLARAMARGRTVIATDFGGSRDYLDALCGYPLPCTLHRYCGDPRYPGGCRNYARIDVEVLSGILARAAEHVAAADGAVGRMALARIAAQYSSEAVALTLRDSVTAVMEM